MRKTANNLKFLSFPIGMIVMLVLATVFVRAGARAADVASAVACHWGAVSSPNVGSTSVLSRVAAISATDVWAVGSGSDSSGTPLTLTENWNGSAWNVVTSPNVGSSGSTFAGITANSINDIWSVGSYYKKSLGLNQTLIEHWNGTHWSVVASPNVSGTYNFLSDIQAVSAKNIWAVGHTGANVFGVLHQILIEHWNGTNWQVVSNPQIYSGDLDGISAVSAKNIWAVGGYLPSSSSSTYQTLTEHWDGTQWSIVSSADITTHNDYLGGVSAISASNIWAVGASQTGNYQFSKTLIEHWNGTQWSITKSSNPDPNNNFLSAATRVPGTTSVWSVGNIGNGSPTQTLTEFHC